MLSTNGVCFSVDDTSKKKTHTEKKFYRAMSENDEENNKKKAIKQISGSTNSIFGVFIKTIYTRDNLISYHTHTER